MKEIFFCRDSVEDGLKQTYEKIKKERFRKYCLLGVANGGKRVAADLSKLGEFGDILSCEAFNENATISVPSKIENKNILICEDIVNTGETVKKVIAELKRLGANDIKIFSLIMKRNSLIVPNIFVFEVEENTRVYFPWNNYPIRVYSKGIVRKIFDTDREKTFECGELRINTNLTEFFLNQKHSGDKVYLVEDKDEICSILHFVERKNVNKYAGLFLKTIATATDKKREGYADSLLKLIELYMLYHEFDFIYAHALDGVIKMYKTKGYDITRSIEDKDYGKMHKIVKVNELKNDKEEVIAAIRRHI